MPSFTIFYVCFFIHLAKAASFFRWAGQHILVSLSPLQHFHRLQKVNCTYMLNKIIKALSDGTGEMAQRSRILTVVPEGGD